jgi:hypothetical protein
MVDLKENTTETVILKEKLKLLKEIGSVAGYEVMDALQRLLHHTVNFLDFEQIEIVKHSLKFIQCLKGKIDQHLHLVIPSLLNITLNHPDRRIRIKSIIVTREICDRRLHPHSIDFVTRIIQTYLEIVNNDELVNEIFEMFAFLVENLGNAFAVYIPVI